MFGPKSTDSAASDSRPLTAYEAAQREYFDSVGAPVVQAQRLFLLTVLMGGITLASLVALIGLLPLKSVEPWLVSVRTDGTVSTGDSVAVPLRNWTPDQAVLNRELFTYVSALLTLNAEFPKLIEDDLRKVFNRSRRNASQQFADHIKRTDPFGRMRADRSLVRTVARNTITFREAGYALVRVTTTERSTTLQQPVVKRYLVTVTYELTPSIRPAELNENPLGLHITSFEIQEEQS
ncbi:MAG: type IV secretion system protein [bacterium]|jgi:type IV secretion system protein VirB8